jgi:hypothetical protein
LIEDASESTAGRSTTRSPSRAQVSESLRRLELAEVVEVRKGGHWVLQASELLDVLVLARDLPGGSAIFHSVAHPVGWSVVAQLTSGPHRRRDLASCGEAPRVTEQLRALQDIGALEMCSGRWELRERNGHRALLDRLDRIAGNLHMRAFERARRSLFDPAVRAKEGMLYTSAWSPPRPSENPAASKAFNYTRAAHTRARSRRARSTSH